MGGPEDTADAAPIGGVYREAVRPGPCVVDYELVPRDTGRCS
jgi:hypothetical protein